MSRKVKRIQKYLKKLHNKQSNIIFSVKKNVLSQIQNNKTGLESNHKDKQYIELWFPGWESVNGHIKKGGAVRSKIGAPATLDFDELLN